jgi:precorrin-6A/cobalt-precorrin-6A reductase
MILVMAGTHDARELAFGIRKAGFPVLCTVVTESAAKALRELDLPVLSGRLDSEELEALLNERGVRAIVDATHPFAGEASINAMKAARQAEVPYIRYERKSGNYTAGPLLDIVGSYEEAAVLAAFKGGVIMLATGTKTLSVFTDRLLGKPDISLIVRMLPTIENMDKCMRLGVEPRHIVALQGVCSKGLNKALYEQYGVTLLITKESGQAGGVREKIEAAQELGVETILIKRPPIEYGTTYSDSRDVLEAIREALREDKNIGFSNGI